MKSDSISDEFDLFIQNLKTSLTQDPVKEYKGLNAKIKNIIHFIEDHPYFREKFLAGYAVRLQKKQNKVFALINEKVEYYTFADKRKLDFSFELGPTHLHILLKTKISDFTMAGNSKKFKDCFSYQNGQWQLWVNGTHKDRTEENKLSQNFPSKYVQKNYDGVPYFSGTKVKYSTYSAKARQGDMIDFKIADVVHLFAIIASAALDLEALHSRGIIHRDVKSDNFLIFLEDEIPYAKITDFGNSIKAEDAYSIKGVSGTLENISPSLVLGHKLLSRLNNKDDLQKLTKQSAILEEMKLGKIPEIKSCVKPSFKDDIYAYVNTAYRHLNYFFIKNKFSFSTEISTEIQSLLFYFDKIRCSSPETQPGFDQILKTILATITSLSQLMPDSRWGKIIKYCQSENQITLDLETKQTPAVIIPKKLQFVQKKIEPLKIKTILQKQIQIIEHILTAIENTEYKIICGAKKIQTQKGAFIKVSNGAAIIYKAAITLKNQLPLLDNPTHPNIKEFLASMDKTLHEKGHERTSILPTGLFNRQRCPGVIALYQFLEQQFKELTAVQAHLSANHFKGP